MTGDPPPRRRRRRAVWRAGAGISRTEEAAPPGAPTPAVPTPAVPKPAAPPAPTPPKPAAPPPPDPSEVARAATPDADAAEPKPPRRRRSDPTERGLRDLVGAGPSQLGPVRAMRARDANRPSDEDLAQAEQDLVIVRRHWVPPKT